MKKITTLITTIFLTLFVTISLFGQNPFDEDNTARQRTAGALPSPMMMDDVDVTDENYGDLCFNTDNMFDVWEEFTVSGSTGTADVEFIVNNPSHLMIRQIYVDGVQLQCNLLSPGSSGGNTYTINRGSLVQVRYSDWEGDGDNSGDLTFETDYVDQQALPIVFGGFTYQTNKFTLDLQLKTFTEVNAKHIRVEIGRTLSTFKTVREVALDGSGYYTTSITFEPWEIGRTVYLKLTNVDFDGKEQFLDTKPITFSEFDDLFFFRFPNGGRSIDVKNHTDTEITLLVTDLNGQKVHEQKLGNKLNTIDINASSGLYIYTIVTNGVIYQSEKIFYR